MEKKKNNKVSEIINLLKSSNGLNCELTSFEVALSKVVDAKGKHLDFDKLLALGKSEDFNDKVEFTKTIANAVNNRDEKNMFVGFTPKCGYAK